MLLIFFEIYSIFLRFRVGVVSVCSLISIEMFMCVCVYVCLCVEETKCVSVYIVVNGVLFCGFLWLW